jgi:Flp pilus assembly protein TadG
MKRLLLSFKRDERGTSLLEFTLCLTVMLMAVFAIMDVSRAIYMDHFVVTAARQGARYAAVRGAAYTGTSCATTSTVNCAANSANVIAFVKSLAPMGSSLTNLTVTPTWPGTDGSGAVCTNVVRTSNTFGCLVTVTVAYSYAFSLPFLPPKTVSLTSTSSQTIYF